jgi:hypothetical protein
LNNNYHHNVTNALHDDLWVNFWIDNADFYDNENMNHIIYFDNFEELNTLVDTIDFNKVSNDIKEHNIKRVNNSYILWKSIIDNIFIL